jgi:hypothetical protein
MGDTLGKLLGAFGLASGPSDPEADILSLVTEWQEYFQSSATIETSPDQLTAWSTMMATLLNGPPNRQEELALLEAASDNPLYGLTLVIAALPGIAAHQAQSYWNLLFAEETQGGFTEGWKIRPFDPPGTVKDGRITKYLIVSDLHRDAASDDRGPLEPGSIDHFKANAALYERILDFADAGGYTLLEGGDCEELWFIRSVADYPRTQDGSLDIAAKMQEIVNTYTHSVVDGTSPGIYEKLRKLFSEERYFRIYGNHDSFLKPDVKPDGSIDDSVAAVLRTFMGSNAEGPFEIYDAFVIEGVKSMMEHSIVDIVLDALALATEGQTPEGFVENLLLGRLGLDSNDYAVDTRMLVTHGHQFDFWNSPEHQILGLLIANSVGMFVDRNMDPFLDLRGIALQGNPLIQFEDAFAGWPVFNSWLSRGPALRFAHQVQHMSSDQRYLSDTIMFSESMAALCGTFGIALNHKDEFGQTVTPAQSRAELDLTTLSGLWEYLKRHHLHHICIGHTHNPHSQPCATLHDLGDLAFPLIPVAALIRLLIPDLLEPKLKTTYFNSGTGGWMEGVIWAIEIDETGQARLVYWTDNSIAPEYMDWELQPLDQFVKDHLLEGLRNALEDPAAELQTDLEEIYGMLRERLEQLAIAAADITAALGRAAMMPIHVLAASLMAAPEKVRKRLRQLEEVPKSIEKKVDELRNQFGQLREFNFDTILSVKRHAFAGLSSATETETLVVRAPISSSTRTGLERLKRILVQMGASEDQALHYAGIAIATFDQFPGNVPFFSSMLPPVDPGGLLEASESPVLHALLSTLWMYPPAGEMVEVGGVRITSTFELGFSHVTLTVVIEPGSAPWEVPEEPDDGPVTAPSRAGSGRAGGSPPRQSPQPTRACPRS